MTRGRKPNGSKRLTTSVRLPGPVHEWVSGQENVASFVRGLIYDAYLYEKGEVGSREGEDLKVEESKAGPAVLARASGYVAIYVDAEDNGVKCIHDCAAMVDSGDPRHRFMVAVRDNAVARVGEVNNAYALLAGRVKLPEVVSHTHRESDVSDSDDAIDQSLLTIGDGFGLDNGG